MPSAPAPTTPTLSGWPLLAQLPPGARVLIAGAGGGFDVFCGLPLYFTLRAAGHPVWLANLTFSNIRRDGPQLHPDLVEVTAQSTTSGSYFPEKHLCAWFERQGEPLSIFCLEKTGVAPLTEAYRLLVAYLQLDAIILVDGGTDSLMFGDEADLGTPTEDALSIAAVSAQSIPTKLLVCLGFGVDAYHGICHAHFLENVATLTAAGAFFGVTSLLPAMDAFRRYADACQAVFDAMPTAPSIVNASILSAVEGHYGDHHRTHRTHGSTLWINPLMALYWGFDLAAIAERVQYLDLIRHTQSIGEVMMIIRGFRKGVVIKPRAPIPV
jgi:hypothetical protein